MDVCACMHADPSSANSYLPTTTTTIKQQGKITEGVFAFFLGADTPGELVIGGVNHERYEGELHYTPLKVRETGRGPVGGGIGRGEEMGQATIEDTGLPSSH